MRRWSSPISSIVWTFQVPISVVLLWRFLLFLVFRVFDFRSFSDLEESSTLQFQSPVSESSLPCGFKLTSSCPYMEYSLPRCSFDPGSSGGLSCFGFFFLSVRLHHVRVVCNKVKIMWKGCSSGVALVVYDKEGCK